MGRLAPLIEIDPENGPRYDKIKLIHDYEYVDGLWFWSSHGSGFLGLITDMDRSLMYIEFTEDVYQSAKSSIFDWEDPDVKVVEETRLDYNGYVFYESYFYNNYQKWFGGNYRCAMAGYNDEKHKLIFISMFCDVDYPELETALTDFEFYLKTFYGDFYDFDL